MFTLRNLFLCTLIGLTHNSFGQADNKVKIRFFDNGIVEVKSRNGKHHFKLGGKLQAKTNHNQAYGGHIGSGDNSNSQKEATNSGRELGDGNPLKGSAQLEAELFHQLGISPQANRLSVDYIREFLLFRTRPLKFRANPDENVMGNTGRMKGAEFEGGVEVGASFKEYTFVLKAGRLKMFGEEPLVEIDSDIAHGGAALGADESAQWGDGLRFRMMKGGSHERPNLLIEFAGYDSSMRIGDARPLRPLSGDLNGAGKIQLRPLNYLKADFPLKKLLGDLYIGVAGAYGKDSRKVAQSTLMGIVGSVYQVGPGKLKIRIVAGVTKRSAVNAAGGNRTKFLASEVAYEFNLPFKPIGGAIKTELFANFSHLTNAGGAQDYFWSAPDMDESDGINIIQAGIKLTPDTGSYLDNFSFAIAGGDLLNTSKKFGGDPNKFFLGAYLEWRFGGSTTGQQDSYRNLAHKLELSAPRKLTPQEQHKVNLHLVQEDCRILYHELVEAWNTDEEKIYQILRYRVENDQIGKRKTLELMKREFVRMYPRFKTFREALLYGLDDDELDIALKIGKIGA